MQQQHPTCVVDCVQSPNYLKKNLIRMNPNQWKCQCAVNVCFIIVFNRLFLPFLLVFIISFWKNALIMSLFIISTQNEWNISTNNRQNGFIQQCYPPPPPSLNSIFLIIIIINYYYYYWSLVRVCVWFCVDFFSIFRFILQIFTDEGYLACYLTPHRG